MRRVVVDASALASVTFGEPEAEHWLTVLNGAVLHAPTLLRYELANAARKKCKAEPGRVRDIITALSLALDPRRGIVYHDPNPMDVVLLANATGLSPYDASYLWLAGFLGADLVTADHELAAAHDAFAAV
ncbi:MAG: type II toxin-antitoxin system VapC family toxin [Vicinamibacterales bacterium]|nr:type II toxin-antitoxin system VapC family toxin [Vicinamibacterales bacterium]